MVDDTKEKIGASQEVVVDARYVTVDSFSTVEGTRSTVEGSVSIVEDSKLDTKLIKFILDNASDGVYIFDEQRQIIYVNKIACNNAGYSREELLTMNISDLDPVYPAGNAGQFRDRAHSGENRVFETTHMTKSGKVIPVEVSHASSIFDDVILNSAFVRDISGRLKDKEALREGEKRFRAISDASPVAIIINKASDGSIQYANKKAEILFGKSQEELVTTSIMNLFQENDADRDVLDVFQSYQEVQNREIMLSRNKEETLWISLNTRPLELDGERMVCSVMLDVSEARELSNQLSYQATYDDLTGLVNRREFENRLQAVISVAHERRTENALCYLDLDQFKIINDTCGHMAGDELLKQLAQVLTACIRNNDTLARLGGDEFAILLDSCSLKNAEMIAEKVREAIQEYRFIWENNTFKVSVSIGLTPIAQETETLTDVLRRADSACYAAKDAGRNKVHIFRFDDEELAHRDGEMRWVAKINSALDEGRFELWQQAITRINKDEQLDAAGSGSHFELLLRMRDENGDLVMPGAFLPAAERYDLASRLDRWVVRQTFLWFKNHPEELESLGMCAINLSGQTLSDQGFLREITDHFEDGGTPPEKICFEITETAAIGNIANAAKFMNSMRDLGCSFALDDFGSGLSSFTYLKNLPVDFVKIDGYFVKDVTTDTVDLAMVKAINDMAHAMGKLTIAEFVEDDDIFAELKKLGVDYAQGYGIAKPKPLIVNCSS